MPLLFGAQLASPKALVWWVGQVGHGNVAGDGTGQPWQLEAIGAFCHLRLPWRHVQAILGVVEADGVFLFINAQCCKVHITNLVPFVGGSRMQ